jgi:two-component system sensor histidine kinase AlgZ
MHPILARRSRVGLYLGLWVLVGGLLAALLVALAGLHWTHAAGVALPLAIIYAFVCLSAWYVARSMPLVSTGAARVVSTALTAALISSAGWLLIARGWVGVLSGRGWIPARTRGPEGIETLVFGFGVLLYLLSLAVSHLIAAFEHSREAERRALEVHLLAREAEVRSLRAQIDPHFLFNSLHSISALTGIDPASARRMCLLLGEFLRDSVSLGGLDRIPLARELGLVERFLSVERVRFGDRLSVEIAATGGAESCLVPPLLLQPLVENAVTHGVAHVIDGGTVRVAAVRTGGQLAITIENPCDPDRPRRTGTGVGMSNVRARLTALHGTEARLSTSEEQGTWRVELRLPAITTS